MTVIVLENTTEKLRGECTRYLMEVRAGVFVGTISAAVRVILWKKITDSGQAGGAILISSAPTEQGFLLEMHGNPRRKVRDFDGLYLIEAQ